MMREIDRKCIMNSLIEDEYRLHRHSRVSFMKVFIEWSYGAINRLFLSWLCFLNRGSTYLDLSSYSAIKKKASKWLHSIHNAQSHESKISQKNGK